MTTIHTRQLQQYTQDNYNNTHKKVNKRGNLLLHFLHYYSTKNSCSPAQSWRQHFILANIQLHIPAKLLQANVLDTHRTRGSVATSDAIEALDEKNFSLPRIETTFLDCQALSLVSIRTKLYRLIDKNTYWGADKSLARLGRKQTNVSVKMVWISLGALSWGGGELDDSSRLDVVEITRVPDMLELVSFLVGLRTYQHPGIYSLYFLHGAESFFRS